MSFGGSWDTKRGSGAFWWVVADKCFPGSKTCSHGAYQLETLPLSAREWSCPRCHSTRQRDGHYPFEKHGGEFPRVSRWRASGSGSARKSRVKPASIKQKSSSKLLVSSFAEVWENRSVACAAISCVAG